MVKTCFRMSFISDSRFQKAKLNNVIEYLRKEIPNISEDDLFDLRLVYNELIANSIIHGHKFDMTKIVELHIEIDDNEITTVIRDEGEGFDISKQIKLMETSGDIFNEHGRGLRLVIGLTDSIKWNEIGNEVIFHKNLRS